MQHIINQATSFVAGGEGEEPPRKKQRVEEAEEESVAPRPAPDRAARSMLLRYHAKDPKLLEKVYNEEFQRIQSLSEDEVQEELHLIQLHHGSNLPGVSVHGALGCLGFVLDRWLGLQNTAQDLIEHPQLSALVEHSLPLENHWSSVPMQIVYILMDIITKKKIKH